MPTLVAGIVERFARYKDGDMFMAHEVDYTTIADEFKRREQALKDLKRWLGPTTYKKSSQVALEHKNEPNAREQLTISMSLFQGISGLPVTVWLDSLGIYPATPISSTPLAETQAPDAEKG